MSEETFFFFIFTLPLDIWELSKHNHRTNVTIALGIKVYAYFSGMANQFF